MPGGKFAAVNEVLDVLKKTSKKRKRKRTGNKRKPAHAEEDLLGPRDSRLRHVRDGFGRHKGDRDKSRKAAVADVKATTCGDCLAAELEALEDHELVLVAAVHTGFRDREVDRPAAVAEVMDMLKTKNKTRKRKNEKSPIAKASLDELRDHQLRHVRDGLRGGFSGCKETGSRDAAIAEVGAATCGDHPPRSWRPSRTTSSRRWWPGTPGSAIARWPGPPPSPRSWTC